MTDPISLTLAGTAAVVAFAAGWYSLPDTPQISEERLFKACLATVWMGVLDAQGETIDTWEEQVVAGVPYHPWVDDVVRWLTADPHTLPATESGSAALLADLRGASSLQERYTILFEKHKAGRQARLSDPSSLGSAYDPSRVLGEGVSWDAVYQWGAGKAQTVAVALSRAVSAKWVVVGRDGRAPAVLDGLVALGAGRVFDPKGVASELLAHAPDAADRLVVAVAGDAVASVLEALIDRPELRDRVLAVVSIGGNCQGPTRTDWMGAHFTDAQMNLEAHRPLLFLALQWLDPCVSPPGFDGLDVRHARFPEPVRTGPQDRVVHAVDLGVLPPFSPIATQSIAQALTLVTGLLVLSGRSAG